jgi:putative transposase
MRAKYLQLDNGPEFRGQSIDKWCFDNDVKILFSRPGTPTDNPCIESFNALLRRECLNANYFLTLKEAKRIIHEWWEDYNENRPQKRLKGMTPREFEDTLISAEINLQVVDLWGKTKGVKKENKSCWNFPQSGIPKPIGLRLVDGKG